MERKEPSLVPEWLKGAAGGATGGTLQFSQQSFHQDGSGSLISPSYKSCQPETAGNSRLGEYDSLPHLTTPEREFYPSLRRPDSSGVGLNDRSNSDLDAFYHSKPSFVFGRGSFYHSNEGLDRDSHLRVGDHGWNYDRAYRDWDKDRASAFTAVNKKEKSTDFSALHRLSAGKNARYDVELPLRRVQSMVASRRINVNGDKEPATELLGALTGSINTTGKLQKADFDHGMRVPSTRAGTPPAFMSAASSESVLSIGEAEDGHASSDLATISHLTTSKPVVETLRLEELELRQSRQLIPMKPSFPKTMVVSPGEKLKPKVTRSVEMGPSIVPKGTQALSQATIVAHQPLVQVRHEFPKPIQNKLIVRQNNKVVIAPNVPGTLGTEKLDGNSIVSPTGSFGSNLAMDSLGISQTSGFNAVSTFQRKPKQLFDRRAVPISSTSLNSGADGGPTQRPKELGAGAEDKRPSLPGQNRTDFFNTLRRKAAKSGDSQSNFVRSDSVLVGKTAEVSKKNELDASLAISKTYAGHDPTKLQESRIEDSEGQDSESKTVFSDSTLETTIIAHSNNDANKVLISAKGIVVDEVEFVATKSSMDFSDKPSDTAINSEEEEEAFLRSLGWEDNAEEEEALTEEEIKAFYEQHGKFLATTARTSWHKQRLQDYVMHSYIESPISSDLTSSETDSADELNVQ